MTDVEKLSAIAEHLRSKRNRYSGSKYKAFGIDPWNQAQAKKLLRRAMASFLLGIVDRLVDQRIQSEPIDDSALCKVLADQAQEPSRSVGLSSCVPRE